jgi:hypothetical protein
MGRAFEGAVEWVKNRAPLDTPPHEYAHIYIRALADDPIVRLGIKQFGSEEALVEHVGQYYANRLTGSTLKRMATWLKQFWSKVKRYFGKVSAKDIGNILGEQFFQEARFPEIAKTTFGNDIAYMLETRAEDTGKPMENNTEGTNFEGLLEELYDNDPGVMFQRSFFAVTGLLLPDTTFAKLYEYARENRDLNLADDFNLNLLRNGMNGIIEKDLEKRPVVSGGKFDKMLKAWFQKANSTTFVSFDRKSNKGRWRDRIIVRKKGNKVIDIVIEPIPLNDEGKAIDPVSNKEYSSREVQTFIEEDQIEFATRNKLIYVRMKDSAFVEKTSNKAGGGTYFARASDIDIKLDGATINAFNEYFAEQYQNGDRNYLQFFFAETQGDNSQIFFSAVPREIIEQFAGRVAVKTSVVEKQKFIRRQDLKANPGKIYLFGDNLQQQGLGGQAKEMRGEPNAIGIPTKIKPAMTPDSFMTDKNYESNIKSIDEAFAKIPVGATIVIPSDGLGTGLAKLNTSAPNTFAYLQRKISELSEGAPTVKDLPVVKIISGGQTGADQAGLMAGQKLGIETGGTAPPGFRTATGQQKQLLESYGLVEGEQDPKIYVKRTIKNAQDADGTVWFGNQSSPGGRLTLGAQAQEGKPRPLINPTPEQLASWIQANNIKVLNVAGNREHTNIGITNKTIQTITEALSVPQKAIAPDRDRAFEQYLDNEIAKNNISDKHKKDMIEQAAKHAGNNPYIYHQLAGIHERWKSIAGRDYLMRATLGGKSVANAWKGLKYLRLRV